MTRERLSELWPVMEHFKDGGEVESMEPGYSWAIDTQPDWNSSFRYRIKPKPREMWINVYDRFESVHPTKEAADAQAADDRLKCIHMREVLE